MKPACAPEFLIPDWPAPSNVGALVTTRTGGVSLSPYQSLNLALHVGDNRDAVIRNRRLLADELPQTLQWQWLEQVHSDKVLRISSPHGEVTADGLITATPGIACCVLTADCLPVFFSAADGSEVAIAHAGWRGMASGIIANTVRAMSVPANQLLVWLGPAIGPCHFEVGAEVRDEFQQAWAESISAGVVARCFQSVPGTQKFMADLYALARLQLNALGVTRISGGVECTFCQQEKFYSYRRSGHTGRLLSMVYLRPAS